MEDFFAGLAMTGTYQPRYDGADDPVVRWHRKWAGQGRHNTLHQIVQLALTVKAWNAYRDAARLPKLTWPAGESFPVPH